MPACPGWTVTGALAHVVGVCIDVADGAIGADVGTAAWADSHVTRFASLGVAGLLARWAEVGPTIDSLEGLMPPAMASQFVFDATSHEHDIRGALDLPGGRDTDAIDVSLGFVSHAIDGSLRARHLAPITWVTPDWTMTVGSPDDGSPTTVEATSFELFRTFGGRRSVDQITSLPWSTDPAAYLPLFEMGPLRPPAVAIIE